MTRKIGTIRDVAKEAGLSIATVSRVMNGAKNVSPETRERVLTASRTLNYLPNPAARALSTSRVKTIAAIIPTIEHSIFAKFIAGIEHALAKRGYSLVLAISNNDETEELEAARKLLGMGAEAFILSGAAHSDALLELFLRRGVPHVFTSVWDPKSTAVTIGYDNCALAAEALGYIAKHGHRKIAVVHGPLVESDRTRSRRAGAASAKTGDLEIDYFETRLDIAGGKVAIRRILEKGGGCTAVLCFSDVLALGAYFGLAEASLRVPEDFSVMGFDNLDWSSEIFPPLTTINLPARKMGSDVGTQLMDLLDFGKQLAPALLPGRIVERSSVRRIA